VSEEDGEIVGPVDLEGLVRHSIELTDRLERAWSDALDSEELAEAKNDLDVHLGALATGMMGAVSRADAELSAAGFDPRFQQWPYDPDIHRNLRRETSSEGRRDQLVVAQMIVLQQVIEAFNALREPSAEQVDLAARSRREWFESGALSLLRRRCRLLLRLTREVERASQVMLEGPPVPRLDLSIERARECIDAAKDSYLRGDVDASVLHCNAALRAILGTSPFLVDDDPRLTRPGALLARVPSLAEEAPALLLLDQESHALIERRADVGVSVPLVGGLFPVIAAILLEPPLSELQQIISDEASESDGV
jgi:PAS domain-containing protein